MQKAWHGIEQVAYCFASSSVKFEGHTRREINDLNPIWVRLLGRSQLSNPSKLPCLSSFYIYEVKSKPVFEKYGFWKFLKTISIFHLSRVFKPKPKLECMRTMSHETQILTIFVSTLHDKNWLSYGDFKIWPTLPLGEVIYGVMSGYT